MGLARNTREEWRKTKDSENEALGWAMLIGGVFVGWLFTRLDWLGGGWPGALVGALVGMLGVAVIHVLAEAIRVTRNQHEGDV